MVDPDAAINSIRDAPQGKLVDLTVRETVGSGFFPEDFRKAGEKVRARGLALVGAGFASEGYLRNINLQFQAPTLDRRTEIINRTELDGDLVNFEILVRDGPFLG